MENRVVREGKEPGGKRDPLAAFNIAQAAFEQKELSMETDEGELQGDAA